jgi:amino-acid N-acetyltransferase
VRSVEPYRLRSARPDDLSGVLALLREASLPEDVAPHLSTFLVAESDDELIGAVGLELAGPSALLRSLVVALPWRSTGVGTSLTDRALDQARARSVETVFLLTVSAAPFFERFGFRHVERREAPAEIRETREFCELCPESARFMKLAVAGGAARV